MQFVECRAQADGRPLVIDRAAVDVPQAGTQIVMHAAACATEIVTGTWNVGMHDPHSVITDDACLRKLAAGAKVEWKTVRHHAKDPKANPQIMYMRTLGGCAATMVSLASTGTPCK